MNDRIAAMLPVTARLCRSLQIGGCDLSELAEIHGTPLYVYDEATMRRSAADLRRAFAASDTRISYAAKACALLGVLRVFREESLGLDVVSGGELEAGLRAGFNPNSIHLHGNYKADVELEQAAGAGIHAIVLDNIEEVRRLRRIALERDVTVNVMMRLTLPLEARTHPHLQTSGARSKFGFRVGSREEADVIALLRGEPRLRLVGLHTHLGSQIRDTATYRDAASEMLRHATRLSRQAPQIEEISIGGGWAVPHRRDQNGVDLVDIAESVSQISSAGLRPAVEPGRALVARAGVAVYRVGSVKDGPTRIIAVDGGMGDNPRPALYGAEYDAFPVVDPLASGIGPASIVGRYCESGDVLVHNVDLPAVQPGDLVAVPVSGAYHLAMASSYNLVPVPAAIMVNGGRSRLLARRGTIDDLLGREEELRGRPGDASVC